MTRAEEAAVKAYPDETRFIRDYNQLAKRQIYQEGYEQAEKDLALTWEDVKLIHELSEDVWEPYCDEQKCYKEVLRRFNEQGKK